jgi:hypothetical protein
MRRLLAAPLSAAGALFNELSIACDTAAVLVGGGWRE